MRRLYERLITAVRVLLLKKVIVIEITAEPKKNRIKVCQWSTIEDETEVIFYLEEMLHSLEDDQSEKDRKFNPQSN